MPRPRSSRADVGEVWEAQAVLRGLGDSGVRQVRLRAGGNCAIYLGRQFVVRVGRSWPLDPRAEMDVWRIARAGGVPAPEAAGAGVLPAGRPYVAYRKVRGVPAGTPAALRIAGQVLARLHQIPGRLFPAKVVGLPRRRRRYVMAEQSAALIDAASRSFATTCLARATVDWHAAAHVATHGDFRVPNLVSCADQVVGVLDWTDARPGSPESDLGQLELSQLGHVTAGYQELSSLQPDPELVAGHMLARHLALEAAGVFPAGISARVAARLAVIVPAAAASGCWPVAT